MKMKAEERRKEELRKQVEEEVKTKLEIRELEMRKQLEEELVKQV